MRKKFYMLGRKFDKRPCYYTLKYSSISVVTYSLFVHWAVKAGNYGEVLTSKSGFLELLAFLQKVPQTASGQCLGSVPPLTYYSYFGEDLVILSGQ